MWSRGGKTSGTGLDLLVPFTRQTHGFVFNGSPNVEAMAAPKTILVAGATGQTGRRIVERLSKTDSVAGRRAGWICVHAPKKTGPNE